MIDPKQFREVLSRYPTGVCVITSLNEAGDRCGLAVGSFTSISLDPPLVGFFPDKRSESWRVMATTGRFCVNVLGIKQLNDCRRYASSGGDKFDGVIHSSSPAGLPVLDGSLAWIECDIERVIDIGDHYLIVGVVRAMNCEAEGSPLIFACGGYHRPVPI